MVVQSDSIQQVSGFVLVTPSSQSWSQPDKELKGRFIPDTSTKSTRLEEVNIPQNLDLLNEWTILKIDIKTIYDYGWFDKISHKQLIKTTEQSLALNSFEQTIRLLNK
ncbi:hypothetical protein H5410_059747 [Solanum commersonii]|uniref:Uncharacterized protein n=1 Tax=Solanum commersonii TaxID=4109 RepID=A0A9J5W394_SOLCO|nr:hypothetical protein H5410_059747 [Solanum commersonii]